MTEVRNEKAILRAQSKGIAPATAEESARVTAGVREVLHRQDWRVVLTYLARSGEVDLRGLQETREFTLLVTRTPRDGPLTVHALTDDLESHPFGYLQPSEDVPKVDPTAIEVVLVPGVLFASNGGRLGQGKAYYDALLSSFRPRPYSIGVTLDRRVVPKLPMTESDAYMDGIATESGFREAVAYAND